MILLFALSVAVAHRRSERRVPLRPYTAQHSMRLRMARQTRDPFRERVVGRDVLPPPPFKNAASTQHTGT